MVPKKAHDLYLSLDKDLQKLARYELAGRRGAVVAIDPNNGLIKTLVSSPDFNPNIFNRSESGQVNDILKSIDSPIFNRAISGNYPPASTLKPFIGLLGIKEGIIDWASTIQDDGFFQINGQGRKYRGWKEEGHGRVNLQKSIVESSDVFYYNLASQLPIESISSFLKLFGFGSKTGIDLYAETEGILPSRKWKLGAIGESWFVGDTINLGIGQGYISCSPIQLAVAMSILATRGKAYKPRVIERIDEIFTEPELIYKVELSSEKNWQKLEDSMSLVVSSWNGTAHNLTEFGKVKIAGKTGTAQIKSLTDEVLTVKEEYEDIREEETSRDHALFIGYGPIPEPKLAVVVIVENGESGSIIAAPIAQKLIDLYLEE
jgi:penicillin-binding protein 2